MNRWFWPSYSLSVSCRTFMNRIRIIPLEHSSASISMIQALDDHRPSAAGILQLFLIQHRPGLLPADPPPLQPPRQTKHIKAQEDPPPEKQTFLSASSLSYSFFLNLYFIEFLFLGRASHTHGYSVSRGIITHKDGFFTLNKMTQQSSSQEKQDNQIK